MIDLVYKTILTLLNKENQGYVSPTEFNVIANTVQIEIFREYFASIADDMNRQNKGLTSRGYSNLAQAQRQKINQFSAEEDVIISDNKHDIPANLHLIEHDGVSTTEGILVEEVERNQIITMMRTQVKPSKNYPVYERYGNYIKVYPEVEKLNMRFIRKPKMPQWTYRMIMGKEMFDPTNGSFQDFELHESEFSNIVVRMLSYFGLNLREQEVIQVAELLKQQVTDKDNK